MCNYPKEKKQVLDLVYIMKSEDLTGIEIKTRSHSMPNWPGEEVVEIYYMGKVIATIYSNG